jgi:nicotinamidase-related amidase
LIDVVNPFDFPGGAAFARRALPYARRIARLVDRARRASVPVVYVNDNFGKWRSDIGELVAFCRRPGKPGAPRCADARVLARPLPPKRRPLLKASHEAGGIIAGWSSSCTPSCA